MNRSLRPLLARPLGVFVIFSGIYLVTWGGHFTSGDGVPKIAWAEAMLLRGSSDIDPGPGVEHSRYGIGHSLLALPPLAVAHALQATTGIRAKAALYTLLFVLNGAVFLWLVAGYLWRTYPARDVWRLVLLLGLATFWWPYTKLDFSEPLVLTCFFGGFLLVRKGRLLPGFLLAGFTLLIRRDAALLIALLGVWQLWRSRQARELAPMALGVLPSIAVDLVSNYVRYDSLLQAGYAGERFSNPLWVGVYGMLFSAGKSLFLFAPPLLLGLAGWRRFAARSEHHDDALLFLGAFVLELITYSAWWDWSGDDSWGVRFMIPAVMLMALPGIELVSSRGWVAVLGAAGVAVNLLGVLISPLTYVVLIHEREATRKALYVPGRDRVDLEDVRYVPRYTQLAGHWYLLRVLVGLPPEPQDETENKIGTPLSEVLPVDRRELSFDFIWLRPRRPPPGPP